MRTIKRTKIRTVLAANEPHFETVMDSGLSIVLCASLNCSVLCTCNGRLKLCVY